MRTIVILLVLTSFIYSQTIYEIPFSSKGNEIELEILNNSEQQISDVKVAVKEKPEWIKYEEEEKVIPGLKGNKESSVTFKFDVEKEAKVGKEELLKFEITGNNQTWEKEIRITILPPDKFELNQNYPNPFNPATTISYTIPNPPGSSLSQSEGLSDGLFVTLTVYDILGREVETLINKEQSPGYYKVEWNANNYASGMYIYQLSIKSKNSQTEVLRKKMLLLR